MSANYQDQGNRQPTTETPQDTCLKVKDAVDNTLGFVNRQIMARNMTMSAVDAAAFEADLQLVLLNLVEEHCGIGMLTEAHSKPLKPLTRGG